MKLAQYRYRFSNLLTLSNLGVAVISNSPRKTTDKSNWFEPGAIGFYLGITVGILVGVPIVLITFEFLRKNATQAVIFWSGVLLFLTVLFLLLITFRRKILQGLTGTARTGLNSLVETGVEIVNAASQGDNRRVLDSTEEIIRSVAATYVWVKARILAFWWMVLAVSTLVVLINAMLVNEQNELIKEQTDLVAQQEKYFKSQTESMNAQTKLLNQEIELANHQQEFIENQSRIAQDERAADLSLRLYDIMRNVAKDSPLEKRNGKMVRSVSDDVRQTLTFLASSLPRPRFDGVQHTVSRERGLIWQALLKLQVDLQPFSNDSEMFDFADMRNTRTPDRLLSLKCRGTSFNFANFQNTFWESCDLKNVAFDNANLRSAEFNHCSLIDVSFNYCDLRGASFDENLSFEGVSCTGALMSLETSLVNGGFPIPDGAMFRKTLEFGDTISRDEVLGWIENQDLSVGDFIVVDAGDQWEVQLVNNQN